ncbi:MAG TPA: DUF58 domain-containing protein [Candidatus Omnitrophota bacterium]|nr:DUF58 domain-containing protein [Candidatus Omnitrophota bacterium]
MISHEILKNVRRIEITTTKLVNDLFGGEYESVFKGQGIEFADVREYVPGDDIRTIDWNVTARSQHPFVKLHVEERELTVFFAVDASASCSFGTAQKTKSEIIAEVCALLAFSAVKNNDKVGVIFFSDKVEKHIPVKKGKTHVLRVTSDILSFKPQNPKTNYEASFDFTNRLLTRRAVVFLVSDFLNFPENSTPLRILSKKHDLIAIRITDPRELEIPQLGYLEMEDPETGEIVTVDTGSRKIAEAFRKITAAKREKTEDFLRSLGVDIIDIQTGASYVDPIIRFFRSRERRAK